MKSFTTSCAAAALNCAAGTTILTMAPLGASPAQAENLVRLNSGGVRLGQVNLARIARLGIQFAVVREAAGGAAFSGALSGPQTNLAPREILWKSTAL